MIDYEKAEKALNYLKDTDKPYAQAKTRVEWLDHKRKLIINTAISESEQKTAAAKEAEAYASQDYIGWLEEYKDAVYECELLKAQRKSAELQWETWRSVNSARKQGQVI